MKTWLIAAALAAASAPALADDPDAHPAHHHRADADAFAAAPVEHGDSVYHLDGAWRDAAGGTLELAGFAGHPVVVVMMYGSCTTACPMLVNDARRLDAALTEDVKAQTRFLLVSFDPDEPAPLAPADPRWRFVTGERAQVRALAMLLGVRYRARGDGHFDHSNLVTVLDSDGRIVHRVEGLMQPMDEAAAAVTAAAGSE